MNSVLRLISPVRKAVGYVRCSTEHQEDSPDQQRKAIVTYAETHGFDVVEWFVDFGKSGTTFHQRPEFMRLKEVVDGSPPFSTVICYDESRWGRAIEADENTYWRVYFRNKGIEIRLVKTSVDNESEFAPMLASFEGVLASQYSKRVSELTLRGSLNNTEFSNGGTAPYGFVRIAVNLRTGTERVLNAGEWCTSGQEKVKWGLGDEREIETVKFIFEERAKGIATVLIAKALNEKNIPTSRRGRHRQSDNKWSAVTIKSIIENAAYYGARVYNRNSMSKIIAKDRKRDRNRSHNYPHWRNPKAEWTIAENAHPEIVTRDLWDKANEVRSKVRPRHGNRYTYGSRYLLTGLIKCSRCGFAFQGMTSRVKGKIYPKYVDGGWKNKRVCSHLGIKQEILDNFAIDSINQTISSPETVEMVNELVRRLLAERPSTQARAIEQIRRSIQQNEVKIDNLLGVLEAGGAANRVTTRIEELEQEQRMLKREMTTLKDEAAPSIDPDVVRNRVSEYFSNFEREIHRAPIEERRLLVQKMISRIDVDRETNVVRFYVRRLPTVTPMLEEMAKKERVAAEVATTRSSGGRT
jgi:site-specific DNA recombinase